MIGLEKLGRKISSSAKAKKPEMKKASPRKPLKDLNIRSIPPPQASAEAQRRGYFRFLCPSSSSKEDSVPKYKSQPRTPKSAPPNSKTLSSKAIPIPNSLHDKNPPTSIRSKKPAKPKTPDLLHRWNQRRPSSREIAGGITEPELIFQAEAKGKNGSCAASTPERVMELEGLKIGSGLNEGGQQFSATPRSNSTPPIKASISPEVPSGSFVAPTPVCFATGHVLAGVQNRRKCRPRGILTVGEEQSSVSGVSSGPQALAEASVCWFSSPLEIGKGSGRDASSSQVRTFDFRDEASVNLFFSSSDAVEEELGTVSVKTKISNLDGKFGMETTPSSGNVVLRTPNSNSSISPFSVIVKRAEASSGNRACISHKEKGEYCYDNAPEISPFYEKSWSNSDALSTPSSYKNSRRNGVISPLELGSATGGMEAMRTLAKPVLGNGKNDISPLPNLSFKFDCIPTPLNSIELNCFQNSRCAELCNLERKEKRPLVSDVGISWRDGLLSRIFEMGELDTYLSLSEAEGVDFSRDANVKTDLDLKIELETGSSVLQEGNGFGSFEFLVNNNKFGFQNCESKVPPLENITLAESFSTEGGGLISSGDSDWTLFYKNNLFEI